MATAQIGGKVADTLKCGLLAAGLACGPVVVVEAAGPNARVAGSVLDWIYLVLVSLSFMSFRDRLGRIHPDPEQLRGRGA